MVWSLDTGIWLIFLLLFTMFATGAEFGPSLEGEVVLAEAEADLADTGVAGCADQYLDDGVQLPDLPLFFRRNTPDAEWGTGEMIEVIVSASRHMRWLMPESSPINIGDISRERGGFLSGHLSHRGGVDADVGIYATGAMQDPRGGFQSLGSNFDVVANWALVSALLDTGAVEFILLDRAHITRLRTYTTQAGLLTEAEAEEVFPTDAHSWTLTGYVRHAPSHDNHLHVRVLCSDGSHSGR